MNMFFDPHFWDVKTSAELWVLVGLLIFIGIVIAVGVPKMVAKARVAAEIQARQAEEEAIVAARVAEAEKAIAATRDGAMVHAASIASDTTRAIVERLTGKAPTAAEANAAVKGAA